MLFLEATLIAITAILFIVGVRSKGKSLIRWVIGSFTLLIVLFIPSFVNGLWRGYLRDGRQSKPGCIQNDGGLSGVFERGSGVISMI